MKIVVIGPSWVGDMVMAQSLFKVLRQNYPDAIIDVLAPAWSRPILEAMPEVHQAIDMPVGHGKLSWSIRKDVARSLQKESYDWSIVLPNSLKSALIPWLAKIPRRTGWKGEYRYGLLNDLRKLDKQALPLMVERYVALAFSAEQVQAALKGLSAEERLVCPAPKLEPDAEIVKQALQAFDLAAREEEEGRAQSILALCPGAEFGRAKKWPERHYAEIAQQYLKQHDAAFIWLFGSEKDQEACENIAQTLPQDKVKVLAGKTSLQQAVALLSVVNAVVANDSGLMHVAAALERPLVAVYGSTSPDYTPPLSANHQVLKASIECSPCFKRECPYGHYRCLEEMSPSLVEDALQTLKVL